MPNPETTSAPRIPPLKPPYEPEIETMLAIWMRPIPGREPVRIFRTFALHSELAPRTGALGSGILAHGRIAASPPASSNSPAGLSQHQARPKNRQGPESRNQPPPGPARHRRSRLGKIPSKADQPVLWQVSRSRIGLRGDSPRLWR